MLQEIWKPISFAPGYEVSSLGRVRSWRLWGGGKRGVGTTSRILSQKLCRDGYYAATLLVEQKAKMFRVNRLVAFAFLGDPPPGKDQTMHADDNPLNNRVENLSWGSVKDNGADKAKRGRSLRGVKSPHAKLTDDAVVEVRRLRRGGRTIQAVAVRFGVSQTAICNVMAGRSWKHVPDDARNGESG